MAWLAKVIPCPCQPGLAGCVRNIEKSAAIEAVGTAIVVSSIFLSRVTESPPSCGGPLPPCACTVTKIVTEVSLVTFENDHTERLILMILP